MENLFVGDGDNKIKLIMNEKKLRRVGTQPIERSIKSEIERKIKERIKNIIDTKYISIIKQQYDVDIKNINSYKPLLVKFFHKPLNFKQLLNDLFELEKDYQTIESAERTFEEFVEHVIYSLEMSKIGAEKDRRNLIKEHIKNFGQFIEKKLNKKN